MKLKKGDKVMVLAGRDRGKTGEIDRMVPRAAKAVVSGVNLVKRHTKPSSKQPRGGILEITMPIAISKVAFICPNCKQPTRIGYQIKGKSKERICRKCKAIVK